MARSARDPLVCRQTTLALFSMSRLGCVMAAVLLAGEVHGIAPDSPIEILVSTKGYRTATRRVQLKDGETKTIEIEVTPDEA